MYWRRPKRSTKLWVRVCGAQGKSDSGRRERANRVGGLPVCPQVSFLPVSSRGNVALLIPLWPLALLLPPSAQPRAPPHPYVSLRGDTKDLPFLSYSAPPLFPFPFPVLSSGIFVFLAASASPFSSHGRSARFSLLRLPGRCIERERERLKRAYEITSSRLRPRSAMKTCLSANIPRIFQFPERPGIRNEDELRPALYLRLIAPPKVQWHLRLRPLPSYLVIAHGRSL
jgi:hypothetical protein